MLMYTTIGTNDLARATAFWGPIMANLGPAALPGLSEDWAGWGKDHDGGSGFYVCATFDGKPAHAGNGLTLAFAARDAAHVRTLYALAMQNGGTDQGAPGTRDDYAPEFFVAYASDPDGHKLAFVFHHDDPATDHD